MIDPTMLSPGKHRVYIEPGTVAHQQFLDGRALMRLREALPEGTRIEMWSMKWPSGMGRWGITIIGDGFDSPPISVDGSTVAEAADKCREALG